MDWYVVYKGRTIRGCLTDSLAEAGIAYYMPMQIKKGETKETPVFNNLIFIQTDKPVTTLIRETDGLKAPYYDRTSSRPAMVTDAEMQRFMQALQLSNHQAELLSNPFVRFRKYQKVRVMSGDFEGYEGHVVRIRRDHKLVISLGDMAFAISGIHHSLLEPIE